MNISTGSRRKTTVRIARLVTACAGAVALWACGPVYIPVPPPGEISFTSEALTDSSGQVHTLWTTRGGPNGNAANATFYIIDQERTAGVIAPSAADGSFVAGPMEGDRGDHISISYRDASGRESPGSCRLLSELPLAEPCP